MDQARSIASCPYRYMSFVPCCLPEESTTSFLEKCCSRTLSKANQRCRAPTANQLQGALLGMSSIRFFDFFLILTILPAPGIYSLVFLWTLLYLFFRQRLFLFFFLSIGFKLQDEESAWSGSMAAGPLYST
jgi:hypothetical protein